MTDAEIRENIDGMEPDQVTELLAEVSTIEAVTVGEGNGIPNGKLQTVISDIQALGTDWVALNNLLPNELAVNIIRPTHNSGGDPNG